jgi:ketosteroid isomerase-like protein
MASDTDERELRGANQEFYLAFSALDIEHMARVWACADDDLCVHPGWSPLRGWDAIRESWERIFKNTERQDFILSNESPSFEAGGRVAHVDLIENIPAGGADPAELVGIAARNSFVRLEGSWRMTAHVTAQIPH